MERAFLVVVVVVGIVGLVGALITLIVSRGTWESLGRDHLLMESDLRDPRARPHPRTAAGPNSPAGGAEGRDRSQSAERDEEIRQMLEARNRRRRRRREPELDVGTELARLTQPLARPVPAQAEPLDADLVREIRELVIARNHRRARRGRPPLDVETEIARQIARLNG